MSNIPNIKMNNGVEIPQLGFGTYLVPPEETRDTVLKAFDVGYRHIDTAQMYGNEQGVGDALRDSGLHRDEVFITSKLNNGFHRRADVLKQTDESLRKLGVDAMDLFLIHWPLPGIDVDYTETWDAMIEIYQAGKARAIGVSNFNPAHLDRIIESSGFVPAANQIEIHPYYTNETARKADAELGIVTEAWSPIATGLVLDDPVICKIAERLGRTPAQVTLRWHVQRGDVVIPKSMHEKRMRENFELFDFVLTPEDMAAIGGLNRDAKIGPDPDEFNWIPE